MKVVLCEKPDVARSISAALEKMLKTKAKRAQGFISVGDYALTWAYGHLVEIDVEGLWGAWSNYPVFPSDWKYQPAQGPVNKYKRDQLAAIRELLKSATSIIIATDPGREGELIARLVLNYCTRKKLPIQRFWTSASLEQSVVEAAFASLKNGSDFDSLYFEALARQHADCLVGINGSRAVKDLITAFGTWSVGRVQTPVLAILVDRELEIRNFKPEKFWNLTGIFGVGDSTYDGKYFRVKTKSQDDDTDDAEQDDEFNSKYRLSKDEADRLIAKVRASKIATIDAVNTKKKVDPPPNLHSITSMQIAIEKKHGFAAAKTAEILQALYDTHKVCSYPRTESEHLGASNIELVKEVLASLGRKDLVPKVSASNKRVFDDAKLTDHHALIPMKKPTTTLSKDEQLVFDELVRSFLAVFYPDAVSELFSIITDVSGEKFESKGTQDVTMGWKEVYAMSARKFSFALKKGTVVDVKKIDVLEKETQPPSRYTEGTLLRVMKNAHLLIPKEQKDLRQLMKTKENAGLGTGATRAGIIDGIMNAKRGYAVKQARFVVPTDKGIKLILSLKGKSALTDPILTAKWEEELKKIRQKETTYDAFINGVKDLVNTEIQVFKSSGLKDLKLNDQSAGGRGGSSSMSCPTCKAAFVDIGKGLKCGACNYVIWKQMLGKTLSDAMLNKLLKGEKVLVRGMKSKAGNVFDRFVFLDGQKVQIDFTTAPPVAEASKKAGAKPKAKPEKKVTSTKATTTTTRPSSTVTPSAPERRKPRL